MVHHMAGASISGVLDCHLVPMHWGPHSGVATCKTKKGVENIWKCMNLSICLARLMLEYTYS